ncbi:cysteine hydrolase [Caulobacter flavus]|uniref:Cysteine hydrolase n=1 Tax=Caulobacter flavus TaxID=1679497 RepID=A0A2N5CKD4_9CAUL|nr:cysteine hydrolase [Caulobacter flavus]PLR05803.1 cysteine hydrolase [Caulobacter flavus]
MQSDPTTRAKRPTDVGLLIIDLINDLDFPGAGPLRQACRGIAEDLVQFRAEADRAAAPTIYVNDNFGQWRAERDEIIAHAGRAESPARDIVDKLKPRPDDFFVIKPRFSGFYATPLPVLLPQLGVQRLILTGVATDICVLFTAADAHMRQYDLWVPENLVASDDPQRNAWALEIMRNSMGACTASSHELAFSDWRA